MAVLASSMSGYPMPVNQHQHHATDTYREAVRGKVLAYHRYLQVGCIAQGLLLHLSLNYNAQVWHAFRSWLRTMNPGLPPSELVVAHDLRRHPRIIRFQAAGAWIEENPQAIPVCRPATTTPSVTRSLDVARWPGLVISTALPFIGSNKYPLRIPYGLAENRGAYTRSALPELSRTPVRLEGLECLRRTY